MIKIDEKKNCCGCTACASICPKECISLVKDEEGFKYPEIDLNKCVDCGMCKRVCPVNSVFDTSETKETYIAQLKNSNELYKSASGGIFAAIAHNVISNNGVVVGAAYDENFNVVHCIAKTEMEIYRFQGSKYVQSNLNDIFKKIKLILQTGKLVCFSGTPCQVAGLNNFLGKKYSNLITVDIVCAGVPSQNLWDKYLDYQKSKFGSNVNYVNFREKTYGYQCSTMLIKFDSGKVYSKSGRIDPMMNFFVSGIAKRPSCYECPFKGISNRSSDITLFDAWHASTLVPEFKDDRGYTSVLINTSIGKKEWETLCNNSIKSKKVEIEDIVSLDGIMINNNPKVHTHRNSFYKTLNNEGLEGCIKHYLHIGNVDYLLENIKPFLYKIGLINYTKKIKRIKKEYLSILKGEYK